MHAIVTGPYQLTFPYEAVVIDADGKQVESLGFRKTEDEAQELVDKYDNR